MADPKSDGRMINKDISESNGFAALSPEAAVLFCMLIPHLSSHGKMNGGPGYVKEVVCFKVSYLTYENIPVLLKEISENTNVKWFKFDGRDWIHSINFLTDHQKLDSKRLGRDLLPTYSGLTPDKVRPEVEVEVEVEVEERREVGTCALGEESEQQDLTATDQHTWGLFRHGPDGMPLRNGKFIDESACRDKWPRIRRDHNQILAALKNYRASSEVQDGKVMNPMKFISGRFVDWLQPEEQPLGSGAGPPAEARRVDAENIRLQREAYDKAATDGAAGPPRKLKRPWQAEPQTQTT